MTTAIIVVVMTTAIIVVVNLPCTAFFLSVSDVFVASSCHCCGMVNLTSGPLW